MNKTIFSILVIFIAFAPLFANAQKDKKDILKQLGFTEGQYVVIVPSSKAASFCEDEIVSLEMLEDKGDVTLVIGANLIFSQINKATTSYESNVNCKTTQVSQIENNKLTITQVEKCAGAKKKPTSKKTQIDFKNDLAELSIKEGPHITNCQYKIAKLNSKDK
ncbi:hypothetical protein CIK05_09210 [Bdellovibrio sp. qaytius]|nr:hypothetical protein CIK05_09210 [Bdellovibrio sp. qaytius]